MFWREKECPGNPLQFWLMAKLKISKDQFWNSCGLNYHWLECQICVLQGSVWFLNLLWYFVTQITVFLEQKQTCKDPPKYGHNGYVKNLADFIKGSVTIATEKKKFIEAIEDRKKKGGGRDMFSSYDEKRRTPAGKHKDSSWHMCEVCWLCMAF